MAVFVNFSIFGRNSPYPPKDSESGSLRKKLSFEAEHASQAGAAQSGSVKGERQVAPGALDGNRRHLNAFSAELRQRSGVPRCALAEELCSQESECCLAQRCQKHSIGIRRLARGADALAERLNLEFLVVLFGQPTLAVKQVVELL